VASTSDGGENDDRAGDRVAAGPTAVASIRSAGGSPPEGRAATDPPRQRWRITYRRDAVPADLVGRAALDAWQASILASGLPVATIAGDPTRARLAFAAPLPAAACGERELVDLWLAERVPGWRLRDSLARVLPAGHHWVEAEDVWLAAPALAGQVAAAEWRIEIDVEDEAGDVTARLEASARLLLASRSIERTRLKGGTERRYDLRPLIDAIAIEPGPPPVVVTRTRFDPERGSGRPEDVVAALGEDAGLRLAPTAMRRVRLLLADGHAAV